MKTKQEGQQTRASQSGRQNQSNPFNRDYKRNSENLSQEPTSILMVIKRQIS
jgi:hypothetical protein